MNYFLTSAALSMLIVATSCEKHKALIEETKRLEIELYNRGQELSALNARNAAMGSNPAALEQQRATLLQNNAKLEQELASLSSKCAAGEQTLKDARAKVDAHNAKFPR
jgi:predicted  nucleic acid-binding Zn-ribbon protein